jgi:leader peptidase (prepilin peptidase) / N-methyltransferase
METITTILEACTNTLAGKPPQNAAIWTLVVILGLIAGSYLNVVIHRGTKKALDPTSKLTASNPKRSFCPNCLHTLQWIENVPILSFVAQRGKCKHCGKPIAWHYPVTEGVAATAALMAWTTAPNITQATALFILLLALLAIGVIDTRTQKIPNSITLPTLAIMLAMSLLPGGLGKEAWIGAGFWVLVMWGLLELGKRLFGTCTVKFKNKTDFSWDKNQLVITDPKENTSQCWETQELPLARPKDKITLMGEILQEEKAPRKEATLDKTSPPMKGTLHTIKFPREAMGMGDVKLMALIGAGVGIQTAATGLAAGAILALVGTLILRFKALIEKENAPDLVAFGPWIAAGTTLAIFCCTW